MANNLATATIMAMANGLTHRHQNFQGNPDDLEKFEELSSSAIRSQFREDALHAWEKYKRERQQVGRGGKKGAHMRALIARVIDLRGATLDEIILGYVDLRGVILDNSSLRGAWFKGANFENASLRGVDFSTKPDSQRGPGRLLYANLTGADLNGANLTNVDLSFATLNGADLTGANLTGADLSRATMIGATVQDAELAGARVYGVSAWDIKGTPRTQHGLIITPAAKGPTQESFATVTADDLEVAQFVYLLLNRKKLRHVLDTLTSKTVLLLGRFSPERKEILEALCGELRRNNLIPIIFDFERSTNLDFTETIKILAGLSLFVIVDLTKPRSVPQELTATVPDYQIPFVPILEEGEDPYSMFADLNKYDWVLKPIRKYRTQDVLVANFKNAILEPAWKKHLELLRRKNERLEATPIEEMLNKKEAE